MRWAYVLDPAGLEGPQLAPAPAGPRYCLHSYPRQLLHLLRRNSAGSPSRRAGTVKRSAWASTAEHNFIIDSLDYDDRRARREGQQTLGAVHRLCSVLDGVGGFQGELCCAVLHRWRQLRLRPARLGLRGPVQGAFSVVMNSGLYCSMPAAAEASCQQPSRCAKLKVAFTGPSCCMASWPGLGQGQDVHVFCEFARHAHACPSLRSSAKHAPPHSVGAHG